MWIFSGCGSGSGLGLFTKKKLFTILLLIHAYDTGTSKESLVPVLLFGEKLKKGCRLLMGGTPPLRPPLTIHHMGYLTFYTF
jgi:hypothetical protein